MIKRPVEILPGGFVKPPQQPPLAKLANAKRVGLGHHRHRALEPALILAGLQTRQQLMQHQHPGDFIGMHTGLQVHPRAVAVTLEAPGANVQGVPGIPGDLPRKVFCHAVALLLLVLQVYIEHTFNHVSSPRVCLWPKTVATC